MMITAVIPTCERPERVARCLDKITGADEVIVTDDSTSDATRNLIRDRYPGTRWIQGPRRGPAANRNRGAREATSDFLAFVDDDCVPAEDWVEKIRTALAEAQVVEGKTICTGKTSHPFEEVVENLHGGLLWSCNLGIRKDLFLRMGGFDEDFLEAGGEDLEFAWRLKGDGIIAAFAPTAVVYHPARRVTIRRWFYRVFQDRWHLLYRLKVAQPRSATFGECVYLVRSTARLLLGRVRDQYRARLVSALARWALFPVWVLHLMKWELRFRRTLQERRARLLGAHREA
jgi:GT2 family glycosyltransferase